MEKQLEVLKNILPGNLGALVGHGVNGTCLKTKQIKGKAVLQIFIYVIYSLLLIKQNG